EIVTVDGYRVLPGIVVPQNARDIVINRSGEVLVYVDGAAEPQNVGQFVLTTFVDEAGLDALGSNLFRETPASGGPIQGVPGDPGCATVRQGYVEASNVNIV